MAKLIIDNEEYSIPDGSPIDAICEGVGIPFSCNSGVCGTCQVKVLEGAENLSDLSQEEKDLGMDRQTRLSCQCHIKSGTVKITY
ncbi:MAG TPA: 2Fe-2S iron-sulfur cluster-binding protein [Candidatus Omnitrophota bacterium]|nr:2Fe-2S iron-sulfur cluster-binding protein [Candidatus Omnitrophota bacterium]